MTQPHSTLDVALIYQIVSSTPEAKFSNLHFFTCTKNYLLLFKQYLVETSTWKQILQNHILFFQKVRSFRDSLTKRLVFTALQVSTIILFIAGGDSSKQVSQIV